MGLGIGIVGLPNVGKSTLFNALTETQNAASANYPFCTIEPNMAVVPVPDARLAALAKIVNPERIQTATVDFHDIAGLVKGASKGEGLGNKFLANIRETQTILHVVRCFENDDIIHVHDNVDPLRDIEIIETELLLADIQTLEAKIERLNKQARGDKSLTQRFELAKELVAFMNEGNSASLFAKNDNDEIKELYKELSLLTIKPIIYCCNVDETDAHSGNDFVRLVEGHAQKHSAQVVTISARMEEELIGLTTEERKEFMDSYNISESGLHQIVKKGYATLGLLSYFTAGVQEVRAWTIHAGWKAPQAAGVIHTDFERGFIRAEVISFDDYIKHQSEAACRANGVLRVEGKEYIMQDGDVVHFLFNV